MANNSGSIGFFAAEVLDKTAHRYPQKRAIVTKDEELTFADLNQRVHRLAPSLPLVMLIEKAHHWPMLRRLVQPDWIIGPGIGELRDHPGLGRHLEGWRVHVWTVNTDEDLALCQDLGVEAVITDRPAYMLERLGR